MSETADAANEVRRDGTKADESRSVAAHFPVWLLSAVLAAIATVAAVALPDDPLITDRPFPWWMLALAFYAGEMLVVHLRFGRDAHSFSMSEVPLVIGLVAFAPTQVLLAQLLANVVVFAVHRRQSPVKLAFNLSQYAVQTSAAIAVYRMIATPDNVLDPVGWLAAIAATMTALVVAHILVNLAIRVSGGSLTIGDIVEALGFSAVTSAMNTILGLLVVHALYSAPRAAAFALIPSAVLYAAYRSFAESRQERARLKALWEATRDLHQSPQLETALVTAARHARTIFDTKLCEILLSPLGPEGVYQTLVGPDEHRATMRRVEPPRGANPWQVVADAGHGVIVDSRSGLAVDVAGRPLPVNDAMLAPVIVDDAMVGVVMVANHIGDIGRFEPVDLEVFETLASQVAVSVENGRLEDSLAALTELKEELRHQALHDSLTGLANRALFSERVDHALQRSVRTGSRLAVLFLDLDDFKTVNDSLGHSAGDELLIAVGNRLRGQCRPDDTIARLGGDEFAVLLEDITGIREATLVAERILSGLVSPFWVENREVTIGASIGIAFGSDGDESDQVLRDADAAMYVAKRSGKGTFRLFESSMHAEVVAQLQMRADLDAAIGRDELTLHYQPVVDLRTGRILGFEALVRWDHPERGLVPPLEFIPFAEDTGLIHAVGKWVLNEALHHHRRSLDLSGAGHDALEIAVNLSAKQLEDPEIVTEVARALAGSGVDPRSLILEVTESVVMNAPEGVIRDLRRLGVRIAVDDFGTGYSSLASLDRLTVDILKVDRTFVVGMSEDHDTSPLISTIVGLGQWLGLLTVVEGIEEQWQLSRVRSLGCNVAQGYHFSRPVDDAAALELVRRQASGEVLYPIRGDGPPERGLRAVR